MHTNQVNYQLKLYKLRPDFSHLSFLYIWLNFPHLLFQARIIQTTPNSITVRSVSSPCDLHLRLVRDGVTSMESMLRAAAARWADRPCLGTRTVLSEEDEPQPNGRVFKKVRLLSIHHHISHKTSLHLNISLPQ